MCDDPADAGARESRQTVAELHDTAQAMRDSMDAMRAELAVLSRSVVDWRTLPNVAALLELWRKSAKRD